MIYGIYNDGQRNFIASAEQLVENGWQEDEYKQIAEITADKWAAARKKYSNEDDDSESEHPGEDEMTHLDLWCEVHGTYAGFWESFNRYDDEVQQ